MKMMKKLAMLLLTLCLTVPGVTMLTYAADGKIMFTDPSTAVGETLEVKGVLEADDAIEDRTIVMSYDTEMLKFKNGDNVSETASGELTYQVKGEQDEDGRVEFLMYFDVLKDGTTKIEVESYKAYTAGADYEEIGCQEGFSTITIAKGDGTTTPSTDEPVDVPAGAATVEVNGETYSLSEEFKESDIPDNCKEATLNYDGVDRKVVQNEKNGLYLAYLVNEDNQGDFFMYVEENATFAPYEEIEISDVASIVLLSDTEGIVLPEIYTETTVTVNGQEFPAWQDTEKSGFCIVYALNGAGQKSLYQFDTTENTYQQFEAPEVVKKDTSFMGKLTDLLQNHLDYVILGTGIGFIIFVILVIVLGIKLHNRNAELDELYDEYGIDFDDEEQDDKKVIKKNRKNNEDDEEKFIRIDDEVEDDLMMEETELVENDRFVEEIEISDVEDDEIEVEFFTQEVAVSDKTEVAETTFVKKAGKVEEPDEGYYDDDDDDSNFEIDFIDLDD